MKVISLAAIDFTRANGIIILTFPPHCSHRLQPLHVSVYSPYKRYNVYCTNRLAIHKPGAPITIYDIAQLVGKAFLQAFTPSNITSGFKATGIWPFNDSIFAEENLCSAVTDRTNPDDHPEPCSSSISTKQPSTSRCEQVDTPSNSSSGGFSVSPENISPFPKAGKKKMTTRGHKKGKSMVLTDSPNKKEIETKQSTGREETKERKSNIKKTTIIFRST